MPGGFAALSVALVLLPGWIYWRLEGSPRLSRTALAELFEVVGAGLLTSGVTALGYVLLLDVTGGSVGGTRLADPTRATPLYVQEHLTRVALSSAAVVVTACALASLLGWGQARWRAHRDDDRAKYEPEKPLWIRSLGNRDHVITVETKDGRSISGYFGGDSVDDEGAPTIYLTPPIAVLTPSRSSRWGRKTLEPDRDDFSENAVTIPGSEIIAVWSPYSTD